MTFEAVNADGEPAPFGVGFHPISRLAPSVDGLTLTVPATTRLKPASPGSAQVLAPVEGTPQDFTRPAGSDRPNWTPPSAAWFAATTGVPSLGAGPGQRSVPPLVGR